MVEAKAEAKARGLRGPGQGHKFLSSKCPRGRGQSSRTPIPGLFNARCYAESGYATSSVCPSLSNSAPYCRLLCLCMKYCIYGIDYSVLYLLTILKNSTSYGQILKPKPRPRIVEAKAKAKGLRGQGQGQGHKILSSRCPRGRGQSSRTPSLHCWLLLHRIKKNKIKIKQAGRRLVRSLTNSIRHLCFHV